MDNSVSVRRPHCALRAVATLFVLTACGDPPIESLDLTQPPEFSSEPFVPAGDTTVLLAILVRTTKPMFSEYPVRRDVPHDPASEVWSVDRPDLASVDRGIVRGLRPGWITVIGRVGQHTASERLLVGVPLDSVAFRFAAREVQVGDTVELFYRRFYADGEEGNGFGFLDAGPRDEGGFTNARMLMDRPAANGDARGDTLRYVMTRPGIFWVTAMTHGRALVDTIRIVERKDGAAGFFRSPRDLPRVSRAARSRGCFTLTYAEWSDSAGPVHEQRYFYLPGGIELDSTSIIRDVEEHGFRIHPAPGARLEIARAWYPLPGDSARLVFESPEGFIPRSRAEVRVKLSGAKVSGQLRDGTTQARVSGERITCQ